MSAFLDASLAVRLDFKVKQNQTFNPLLTFVDAANAPISLLGATAKLSVRQKDGCGVGCDSNFDSPFNLLYHQDFIPTVTGLSNNKLQFNESVNLSPGSYGYDLLIEFPSGEKQYYLTGLFTVKKSYTSI